MNGDFSLFNIRDRSGSAGAVPMSTLTFHRYRCGPSWSLHHRLHGDRGLRCRPLDLTRAFSALVSRPEHFALPEGIVAPSSLEIHQVSAPPPSLRMRVHSPTLPKPCRSGRRNRSLQHPVPSVFSQHLDGFLRFMRSRACCIPLPVLRFARFPASRDRCSRKSLGPTVAFPTDAPPLEESPSPAAGPRHRGLLPSCRYQATAHPSWTPRCPDGPANRAQWPKPLFSLANALPVPQRTAFGTRSASSCLRTDEAPVQRQPKLTADPHVVGSGAHRGATPHGTMATSKTAEAVCSGQAPRRSPIHHTEFALTRSLAETSDTRDAYGTHRPPTASGKRTSHTAGR
jgi:hypothetical protein